MRPQHDRSLVVTLQHKVVAIGYGGDELQRLLRRVAKHNLLLAPPTGDYRNQRMKKRVSFWF